MIKARDAIGAVFKRRFSTATILAALAAAGLILCVSGVVAYNARRYYLGHRALRAGQAALERQDWAAACDQLKQYLWRYPDDEAILETYVEANLDVRPREDQYVAAAEHALRRLFQSHPSDAGFASRLARLYFSSKNYTEAAYVCRQRLAADPDDVDATVYLARSLIARRSHDAARKVLAEFAEDHDGATDVYLMLSSNALQEQVSTSAEEARVWLDRAVQQSPDEAAPFIHRAVLLRTVQRDHDAARADLARAHELKPNERDSLLLLAEQWVEYEEWDRVGECMSRLECVEPDPLENYARHPDADVVRIRRIEAAFQLGRGEYDTAAKIADRALDELSEEYRGHLLDDAIDVYVAAGRLEQARRCIDELDKVIREEAGPRAPRVDRLDWHSARLARAEGRLDVAIAHLHELLQRTPSNTSAWLELANALEATGQWRPTGWALEQYLLRVPDDDEVMLRLARLYRSRNAALAARFAGDAEKFDPESVEPTLLRIEAVLDLARISTPDPARLERIEQRLELLRQSHPADAQVVVLQARLAAARGADVRQWTSLLDAARQMDGSRRELDDLQVGWLWQAGRQAEAMRFLDEQVNRHADFEAYRLRAQYQSRAGDAAAAERDYQHLSTIPGRQADGFLQLGEFYRREHRGIDAAGAFRAGLKCDPTRIDLRLRLAESLVQSCEPAARAQGLNVLEDLLSEHPVLVDAIVLKARCLLDATLPASRTQATTLLEQAVKVDPRCAAAHVLLISNAVALGQTEQADALLARALSADPDSADLVVQQARLQVAAGHSGVAEELGRQALLAHPASPAAHILLAELSLRRGVPARARQLVQRALELDPTDEDAVLLAAEIEQAEGQIAQAEARLTSYVARQSGCRSVRARVRLAELYMRRGDFAMAERPIREAYAIAPANVEVLRARVRWLVGSDRMAQLRVDLAAVDLDQRQRAELHIDAASAMIEQGVHLETAAALLAEAAGLDAREDRAELLLARLHTAFDRHAEAEQVLQRLLDRSPYQRDALGELVVTYIEQERWSDAVALADRALARYPTDAELLAIRGSVLLQLGRLDGAEADLRRCLRHAVLNPRLQVAALIDLGEVYLRRGNGDRARESFDEALAIDADHAVLSGAQRERIHKLTHID